MTSVRTTAAALGIALTVSLLASPSAHTSGPPPAQAAAGQRPNVVLILVDDARRDDLSTLPRIRNLIGTRGVTFKNAYSPFPLCCPARATLLTGQYAHNHGVLDNAAPLGGFTKFNDAHTLATWLTADYTTALIGKYLNEYAPPYVPPGWDHWMVPDSVYNYRATRWSIDGVNQNIAGYQTNTMAKLATGFINAHAKDPRPFFLYTSIVAPHSGEPAEPDDPNTVYRTTKFPTPNVSRRYRNTFRGLANRNPAFDEADVSDKPLRPAPLANWEIAALTEVNAQRRESLLSAQDATVAIIHSLKTTGVLDNTYVFFISDNGYLLGEHRIRGGKVFPYEVASHIPMLLRGPGIPAGSVVRQPVGLQDFAPTVLGLTSETAGTWPFDGVNTLPMIGHPKRRQSRPIVLEAGPASATCATTDHGYCPFRWHAVVALLDGTRWKYVVRDTGFKELYNLNRDSQELVNIAGRPTAAAVASRMQTLLDRYQWCAAAACR
jgi:N-acetylglucosamine-6-sulfatase